MDEVQDTGVPDLLVSATIEAILSVGSVNGGTTPGNGPLSFGLW